MRAQVAWTEEEITKLKFYHYKGWSAGKVATKFINKTRNAIIGKLYRLGLIKRVKGIRTTRPKDAPEKSRKIFKPKAKETSTNVPDIERQLVISRENGVELVDLKFSHCRWPFGEGLETYYCGQPKLNGGSYCECHASLAFNKASPRPFYRTRRW